MLDSYSLIVRRTKVGLVFVECGLNWLYHSLEGELVLECDDELAELARNRDRRSMLWVFSSFGTISSELASCSVSLIILFKNYHNFQSQSISLISDFQLIEQKKIKKTLTKH
jgi:hypothetical protein